MATSVIEKREVLKRVILANTLYLINKSDLKVGKVEEMIGVSTGYLSRLSKEDNNTKIGLDIVSSLSSVLSVPMDLLCHVDLTKLSPNEQSAALFVGKLTDETVSGSRVWNKNTDVDFAALSVFSDGSTANPLIKGNSKRMWYASKFADTLDTKIAGEMFMTNIGLGNMVYLTQVVYKGCEQPDYELYICTEGMDEDGDPLWEAHPVCATMPNQSSSLDSLLSKLYKTISEMSHRVQLNDYVKKAIENYMNPPAPKPRPPKPEPTPVNPDELPF